MPSPALSWTWDPVLWLGLIALGAAYFWAVSGWRSRHHAGAPTMPRHITYFTSGLVLLALTLVTPLDSLGRTALFSAHMLQLMLINTLIAPLLLLGLPEWLVLRLFQPLTRLGDSGTLVLWAIAALIFNATFLFWHVGPVYEAGLRNEAIHDLESLTIILTGAIRWWPLLTPDRRETRMANPVQILYILLESLPLDIFAIAILFARAPHYATYATALHPWGLSAMLDQQIAGCIALIPGTFLDIVLISIVFFAWIHQMERDQVAEDERLAAIRQRP